MLRCLLMLMIGSCFAFDAQEEYAYMDQLAVQAGADKGSFYHDYTRIYSRYFGPIKEEPIKFLEIGIDQGNSARLWEKYFPNAELHFIDITFERVKYASDRSFYHLTNQEDAGALVALIEEIGGGFDIILDDGGHTMNQQIVSLETLLPFVKSGGMYIIEDLHTSYWPEFGGEKRHPRTTIAFLKGLIDAVNFVGFTTAKARHIDIPPEVLEKMDFYQTHIESIHFYDSVAIIIRR